MSYLRIHRSADVPSPERTARLLHETITLEEASERYNVPILVLQRWLQSVWCWRPAPRIKRYLIVDIEYVLELQRKAA